MIDLSERGGRLMTMTITVIVIIVASAYEWFCCLSGRKVAVSTEVEYSHTRDFVIQAAGGA